MASTTPAWGPKDKHRLLNTRLTRVDAPLKATGTAQYTYDVKVPGMLYGRILRCPYPRARVTSVNLNPALAVPGVVAAVKGNKEIATDSGFEVHFEGWPVAAVAATTLDQADDGIHAIEVKYEVLPHAINAEQAMAPDAPALFPNDPRVKNNARIGRISGDPAKADAALADADVVVEAEYRTPTLHHTCLETHGVVVDYNGGDSATIYCSTQGTFAIPRDAIRPLGLDESAITGVVQHMGGGFGAKVAIGIEGILACELSKMAKAPVKMMLNRKDEFVMAGNGGGSWQKFKAGANKDGKTHGFHSTQLLLGGVGPGSLQVQPYIYQFPAGTVYNQAMSVFTNVDSNRPLRAPGSPAACFAIDSMMDELAYKIGMDPLEFRIRNLTDETYHRQLRRGAAEIGWDRRNPVPGAWPGTLKRGFGCAIGAWGGGGRAGNDVTVTVSRDGKVTASVGTQDLGTGTRTYIVAIVAEELGLEMEDVQAEIGSTKLGAASQSGGSSTTPSLSPVVKSAAFKARAAIAEAVAPLLGAQPDDVLFAGRSVSANGKTLTWQQACAALPAGGAVVQGEFIASLASNRTHGASFAEVEVDMETGHVRPVHMVHVQDCGLPLNRLAVESQINGGMVQGVGMALLEGAILDPRLGFMLNSSFMDYKIPGCMEMPEMTPIIDDGDERNAVVGMGEPPSIPPATAIANAIFNACGVRVRTLPITPDKILMGLTQTA
jgi:xanthine dehydrogenase YagR molybdenum-binding subunit